MAHILLAEDNLDLQQIYRTRLESDGHSVIVASDGKAAFDRIREQKPDLILLDIIMPGMDGFEFLRRAKKDVLVKQIPVVVMTNLGQNEDREECEKYGIKGFLVKTEMSIDQLSETVKGVLT